MGVASSNWSKQLTLDLCVAQEDIVLCFAILHRPPAQALVGWELQHTLLEKLIQGGNAFQDWPSILGC